MSFSVAALLYLVTEELLTEAHEVDETPLLTSMFFVGFVALLTIEMLVSSSDEVMLWHGSPTAHREAETAKAHRG